MSLFLVLTSCEKDTTGAGEQGRLTIKLTDDPFPIHFISEANVTINQIEIRSDTSESGNKFITLSTDPLPFNLLELQNGVTANLVDLEVPVGNYNLIRLYVAEASVMLTDSTVFNLTIPSGSQTGIKIIIKPSIQVEGGLTAELLLDFDVNKSFNAQGNINSINGINGFHFKPVIRAVNVSSAGRILGIVSDTSSAVIANASVWVEQDTVVSTTFCDSSGYYSLIGLPAGLYSLNVSKVGYSTTTIDDIIVFSGNQTEMDLELIPE